MLLPRIGRILMKTASLLLSPCSHILWIVFVVATGAATWAAETGPPARTRTGDLVLLVWAEEPNDELRLAASSLGLPVRWQDQEQDVPLGAVVTERKRESPARPSRASADLGPDAYEVTRAPSGDLCIAARSRHGLANGLYDTRRALLCKGDRLGSPGELLAEGEHKPCFGHRSFYHFMTTWDLQRLTAGIFTKGQWETHLQRMRALNATHFYFDIWSDQYYHPDYSETHGNRAVYDRLRAACDHAHRLGMRTGVYLFPCQVPASVYQAHPEARGVEAVNYHGINMCPSRAWETVSAFDTYLLRYFGDSVDDVVVEMQDPGSCLCEECCKQFPELVLRFIDTYRKVPGGPSDRRIELCSLHFRDWLEEPAFASGVAFPIKDLRARVFKNLPKGTMLFDIDEPTLALGREHGLGNLYFFFDLDPESGLENEQVLPRVKLRRIQAQVSQSVARGHDGVMAYRMMPFAQHVADYALFRKLWDPELPLERILAELAAEWKIGPEDREKFVRAMFCLDAWWEEGDHEALREAEAALRELAAAKGVSAYLVDLKDQVVVLAALAAFRQEHEAEVARPDFFPPPELVAQVRQLMLPSRIFEAYTVHQHWELRSREMIAQRIRWWLQSMR